MLELPALPAEFCPIFRSAHERGRSRQCGFSTALTENRGPRGDRSARALGEAHPLLRGPLSLASAEPNTSVVVVSEPLLVIPPRLLISPPGRGCGGLLVDVLAGAHLVSWLSDISEGHLADGECYLANNGTHSSYLCYLQGTRDVDICLNLKRLGNAPCTREHYGRGCTDERPAQHRFHPDGCNIKEGPAKRLGSQHL